MKSKVIFTIFSISHPDFCLNEVINKIASVNPSAISVVLHMYPPYPQIEYNLSGLDVNMTIPDSILCSNCYKKLSNPLINYTSTYPLDSGAAGSLAVLNLRYTALVNNITQKCG